MPIARSDFDRMSLFGRDRLRTAVVIENARADYGHAEESSAFLAPAFFQPSGEFAHDLHVQLIA